MSSIHFLIVIYCKFPHTDSHLINDASFPFIRFFVSYIIVINDYYVLYHVFLMYHFFVGNTRLHAHFHCDFHANIFHESVCIFLFLLRISQCSHLILIMNMRCTGDNDGQCVFWSSFFIKHKSPIVFNCSFHEIIYSHLLSYFHIIIFDNRCVQSHDELILKCVLNLLV